MAGLLADPTTLVVGAAGLLGGLFFLQQQLGKPAPGEEVTDDDLDELTASIEGPKKSKKGAPKKAKKNKKKAAAPKPAPKPAAVEVDDDDDDEVAEEPAPVKEEVQEPPPATALSKKAKKKKKKAAAAAAAAAVVETEPEPPKQEKVTKSDISNLLSKSKAEAAASGKKKKKKKGTAAASPVVTAPAPAPTPKPTKPVEEEVTVDDDDDWVTIESSSTRRKKRQAEELKAIAAANAAANATEDGEDAEALPPAEPSITVSIKLGSFAGFVIGRGGSRVKEIQAESGAHIDIEKDNSNTAKITGVQAEVDWASKLINDILSERAVEASKKEIFIPIGDDPSAVKRLIGRGGGNIRYIQDQTGIKVDVQQEEGRIRLWGMPEFINEAKDLATQALDGLNIQAGPQSIRTISLDDQGIITFIGRGGATIRQFNEDFPNCRFDVDKTQNSIRVSAPTDSDVDQAIDAINKLLLDSNFTDMIDISDCTGAVIGKGGETIKRIQKESGARLDIEKEDYGTFLKVTGMPEHVQLARDLVENIRTMPPPKKPLRDGEVDFEIELGGASSAVIGRKGVKINSIQKESGAKLDIGRGSSTCRIIGTPEAVESAKALVLAVKAEWDERNGVTADDKEEDNAFAADPETVNEGGNWAQPALETTDASGWGAEPPAPVEDSEGWGSAPAEAGGDWGASDAATGW